MKKRILHVLNSNIFTGAENIAVTIIRKLSHKYDFGYASREGPVIDVLKREGIEYLSLNITSPFHIRKTINMWKPDIIHAHDYRASVMCAAWSSPVPVVGHLHGYHDWLSSVSLRSLALLAASLRLEKIIACTPVISDKYIFAHKVTDKIKVLSNVTDINRVFEMSSDMKPSYFYDIGFMGRIEEAKDPLRFIHIVHAISKSKSNIRTVMIGDGTLMENCIHEIRKLGLKDNIHMKGFMDNPFPTLKNTRVFVMTSKHEGLPLAAMEAMSLGLPVFATEFCGLEPFIADGTCGKICSTDYDFVSNILEVLNDDKRYKELSQKACIKTEQLCSVESYINQIDLIYSNTGMI